MRQSVRPSRDRGESDACRGYSKRQQLTQPLFLHPFGTLKMRMGATHFLMKTLPRVGSEMALHVLAYNLTRVMNIMGIQPLMAVMRA